MAVILQPITADNWVLCIRLEPTEDQQRQGFVAPNVLSLAQAYAEPWWIPRAIYADGALVGFVMYGRWPEMPIVPEWGVREAGIYHVVRLMIDHRYQGRGYGRASLEVLLAQIRTQPDARAIEVNYDPANEVAATLYTQLGFQPTGQLDDGEIRARLVIHDNITANF
jgi:diamine N-acetyltransferase